MTKILGDDKIISDLADRYISCAKKAAEFCGFPEDKITILTEEIAESIFEADKQLEVYCNRSSDAISLGKLAGTLCYWLNRSQSVVVTDWESTSFSKVARFRSFVAIMFVVETILRTRPPENVMAETIYYLWRGELSQQALCIVFELIIQISKDHPGGDIFDEAIR